METRPGNYERDQYEARRKESDNPVKPLVSRQNMANAMAYNVAVAAHNKLLLKYNLSTSDIARTALKTRLDASEVKCWF